MKRIPLLLVVVCAACEESRLPDERNYASCDTGYDETPMALTDDTKLGFSARQALDAATKSWTVDIKMGDWPATKLDVSIAYDAAPVFLRTKQTCMSYLSTRVVLSLKSHDGKLASRSRQTFRRTVSIAAAYAR